VTSRDGVDRASSCGRKLWVLLALMGSAALLALAATPAGAIIYRVSKNHYLSYAGIIGKPTPTNVHLRKATGSNFDAINTNLDYSGGPVMPSSTNYVFVWKPSNWPSNQAFESGQNCGTADSSQNFTVPCTDYVSGVEQFFIDLAHDSGLQTNSDSVSTQFNDAVGGTHWAGGPAPGSYSATYGGVITDTNAYPPSGCPGAPTGYSSSECLTDAQIQAELQKVLSQLGKPAGLTNEYYLLTPPGVASCFAQNPDGSWDCSGNAGGTGKPVFCAYHSQSATSGHYLYSNIPDMDLIEGCDPFSTAANNFDCSPNGYTCIYNQGWAEGVLSAVSHEHNESVTDPQPNNAWTDWGSNVGGENGDKCNNDGLDDPNMQPDRSGNDPLFTATPYNEVINGHFYLIQEEWSNDGTRCLDKWTPSGAIPGASFIVSSQSGRTVTFNAAGSCGNASAIASCSLTEYVWQFNDNTQAGQPPQNTTVETSSPTITHTFPADGTYTVALTTMTGIGFSHGSEASVHLYATPTANISAHGSGLAGTTTSFSSAGTTHDPSLSITGYLWHFGDGGSSTSANPSHVYTHAGTYSVSLTVTDSRGQMGTASGHLTISASCRVPNLKGKTLSGAQSALHSAGCALGTVKRPHRKRRHHKLVVKSQTVPAGAIGRAGSHVGVTLRYK
jgi:PKD domain